MLVGGKQIRALFENLIQTTARPTLARERFENVDFGADERAAGFEDLDAGVLALAQQGAGVFAVQGCETVEFGRQLDQVATKGGDVARAALLVQTHAVAFQLADLGALLLNSGEVAALLVVDVAAPFVELVQQWYFKGAVDGFGEDLFVVGNEVLDTGGGEERVGGTAGECGGLVRVERVVRAAAEGEGVGAGFFEACAGLEGGAKGGGGVGEGGESETVGFCGGEEGCVGGLGGGEVGFGEDGMGGGRWWWWEGEVVGGHGDVWGWSCGRGGHGGVGVGWRCWDGRQL